MNGMSLVRLRERFLSDNWLALNVFFQIYKINQIIIMYENVQLSVLSSHLIRYIGIFLNRLKFPRLLYLRIQEILILTLN